MRAFTDGGTLESNPSLKGGTWAYYIDAHRNDWGILHEPTTNNRMEFYAILRLLESLDTIEQLTVITDSKVAMSWWKRPRSKYLPTDWIDRAKILKDRFTSIQFEYAPRKSTPELTWCDRVPRGR